MPLEQHPTDPDKMVYASRHYDIPQLQGVTTTQRPWVDLTDEEIDQGLVRTNYAMQTAHAWRDGVEWATKQLKEKNG
jgi:hypothetical protein